MSNHAQIEIRAITNLTLTHTSPVTAGVTTVFFNASIAGGTDPIVYSWDFGDGTTLPPNTMPTASHVYETPGVYVAIVTASNVVGSISAEVLIEVADPNTGPITNLAIQHSPTMTTNVPIHFTATHLSGAQPISYAWDFDDGTPPLLPDEARASVSHTFTDVGRYMVKVAAYNGILPPATANIGVSIPPNIAGPVFLPIIVSQGSTPTADLTCTLMLDPAEPTAGSPFTATVQIRNQGLVEADGFWVDFYINPTTIPSPGNLLRWEDACGGPFTCPSGIAWGVSENPLPPSGMRNLVSKPNPPDPNGFDPSHTTWTGMLPAGTHNLYAYVDSIDNLDSTSDGAVLELDETNNLCEILNLPVSAPSASELGPSGPGKLPAR